MFRDKASTIYDLVSARAEHAPNAVAIGAPGRSALTYGGLLGQVDELRGVAWKRCAA